MLHGFADNFSCSVGRKRFDQGEYLGLLSGVGGGASPETRECRHVWVKLQTDLGMSYIDPRINRDLRCIR